MSNRRITLALGLLVTVLLILALSGAIRVTEPADVVTATRFVLVDEKGTELAVLGLDAEQGFGLRIKGDDTGDVWLGVRPPEAVGGSTFKALHVGGVWVSSYVDGCGINVGDEIRIKSEVCLGRRLANVKVKDVHGQACAILGAVDSKVARTGVVEQRPVGSLVLLGPDGERIFAAP